MPGDTPPDAVPQVLAEVLAGDGLGLAAAGRLFPGSREDRAVNSCTVGRWGLKGVKAADGHLIRLEICRIGSRWMTSRAAIARFVNALSAADPIPAPSPPQSPSARLRASRAAAKRLEERGA